MSDIRAVLRDLGSIFLVIGGVTLVALAVPLIFTEYSAFLPILLTAVVYFLVGSPLYFSFKKADPANFKSAMVTAALGWLIIPLIGVIPFLLIPYNVDIGSHFSFLSAYFESMSGWTGTGLTMVNNENLLPHTLQFWRTWIQWIGGVGVIVLTLSILARPGVGSYVLYRGEARDQRTHPSIIATVRTIWRIYFLYTLIGIIVVILFGWIFLHGMGPWEAVNHCMTAIATGGFSVTDDSLAGYGAITQLSIIVLMIIGAIAFAAHYHLLRGRIRKFFSDAQLQAMLILIFFGVIILILINMNDYNLPYQNNFWLGLKDSGFQFISALTCTGFQTTNVGAWSESAKLILALAMIIGGAAGSTAGGIKLFRIILLEKGVSWKIKRTISTPHRVFVNKLGGRSLSNVQAMDLINEAAIVSFMWIILLMFGIFVIGALHQDQTLGNVIFEVCSAQGNVGLSIGITNISMSIPGKLMLIFNMWIGRLEIIPVIVLIRSMLGIRRNII
ncbi:MAG: TrkH family potassium uptake protein [Methanobacteriota archaeon]